LLYCLPVCWLLSGCSLLWLGSAAVRPSFLVACHSAWLLVAAIVCRPLLLRWFGCFRLVVIGLLARLGSSLLLGYCHWLPARLLVVGHWLVCFVIRLLADCRFRLGCSSSLSVGWFRWLLVGSLVAWLLCSLLHGYCRYWLVACCHCHCLSVWLAYRHFARQSLPSAVIAGSRQLSLVVIAVRRCWLVIAAGYCHCRSLLLSLRCQFRWFGWVARSPVGCCQFRCQLGFAAAGCRRSGSSFRLSCRVAAAGWLLVAGLSCRRPPLAGCLPPLPEDISRDTIVNRISMDEL
jgi:hypothetical protein